MLGCPSSGHLKHRPSSVERAKPDEKPAEKKSDGKQKQGEQQSYGDEKRKKRKNKRRETGDLIENTGENRSRKGERSENLLRNNLVCEAEEGTENEE